MTPSISFAFFFFFFFFFLSPTSVVAAGVGSFSKPGCNVVGRAAGFAACGAGAAEEGGGVGEGAEGGFFCCTRAFVSTGAAGCTDASYVAAVLEVAAAAAAVVAVGLGVCFTFWRGGMGAGEGGEEGKGNGF